MERSKKFQDFINRLPETGTPLIEWHKWLIRNHFYVFHVVRVEEENTIQVLYYYDGERYKGYGVLIHITHRICSDYYFENKIKDYLEYEKKYETAPIAFKEYNKTIEEKNIQYFNIDIYNLSNTENESITVY